MPRRSPTGALLALALLLPIAVACGSDDAESDPPDVTTEASPPDTQPDATEPDDEGATDPDDDEGNGGNGGDVAEPAEPSEELVAAAVAEGRVVWYSPFAEAPSRLVAEAFEEKYPGIEVEYTRLGTGPLLQRYTAERDAGTVEADVLTAINPVFFVDAEANGWIEELDVEQVPALAGFPEEFMGESGNYMTINIAPHGIIYNTDLVDAADITEWRDLADPAYRDWGVVLVDPRVIPGFGASWLFMEDLYGESFLSEELSQQNLALSESGIPLAQQVAAGEFALGHSIPSVIIDLQAEGAPIEIFIPEDTTSTDADTMVSTDAPHPNAALLFMNYLISVEGQTVLNENVSVSPLAWAGVQEIPGTIDFPSGYVAPDVPAAIQEADRLVALVGIQ